MISSLTLYHTSMRCGTHHQSWTPVTPSQGRLKVQSWMSPVKPPINAVTCPGALWWSQAFHLGHMVCTRCTSLMNMGKRISLLRSVTVSEMVQHEQIWSFKISPSIILLNFLLSFSLLYLSFNFYKSQNTLFQSLRHVLLSKVSLIGKQNFTCLGILNKDHISMMATNFSTTSNHRIVVDTTYTILGIYI